MRAAAQEHGSDGVTRVIKICGCDRRPPGRTPAAPKTREFIRVKPAEHIEAPFAPHQAHGHFGADRRLVAQGRIEYPYVNVRFGHRPKRQACTSASRANAQATASTARASTRIARGAPGNSAGSA